MRKLGDTERRMIGGAARRLRAIFAIEGPEALLSAQLMELRGQLPIIYFGMVACAFFVAALFFDRSPVLIGALWTSFSIIALWRGLHWSRLDPQTMSAEAMRRELSRLRLFALLLAAFCTASVGVADSLALPHERTALILFVAFCGVGSSISLAVFKPASRIALAAACTPYPAYVALTQDGAAQVVAIIILVSVPVGLRQYGRIGDFFRTLTLQSETAGARRRLAEERQRTFLEAATDWAWEIDAERRLTYISSNFATFIGRPEQELIGIHVKEFSANIGMRLLSASEDLQTAFDEQRPYRDAIYSLPRADGETVYVSSAAQPRFSEDGAFIGYIGWTRNITSEFVAKEALKVGEQRFRDFAESASDWFWEADDELRYSWVSERAAALSGIGHNGVVGMRMGSGDDAFAPGDRERFLDAIERRAPFKDVLFSLPTADGNIWVRQSGMPYRDATGRFGGYRGVCRNVTPEIEARRALERSQKRLESVNSSLEVEVAERTQEIKSRTEFLDDVVASLPDGLVVFDEEFRITARNDACIEISGLGAGQWSVGNSILELLELGVRAGLYEYKTTAEYFSAMRAALDADGCFTATRRQRDGRIITEHLRRRRAGGYIVSYSDVTPLVRAREEATSQTTLLQEVFECMAEGVLVLDEETNIVAASKKCAELSGTPAEGWTKGASILPLLDLAVANRIYGDWSVDRYVTEMFGGLAREGAFHTIRTQQDGRVVAESVRSRPKGGVVITYHDITDLKRREAELDAKSAELEAQMDLFREVISSMADGLLVVDEVSHIVIANEKCAELSGSSAEIWAPGSNVVMLLEEGIKAGHYPEYDSVEAYALGMFAALDAHGRFETLRVQADGRVIVERVRRRPKGGCVITYSDITDLQRRERELAARTQLLNEVVDSMAEGLLVLDENMRVALRSRKVAELLGDDDSIRPGDDIGPLQKLAVERGYYEYKTLEDYGKALFEALAKDGRFRALRRGADGRTIVQNMRRRPAGGVVVTYHDITDLKQREQELASRSEELRRQKELLDEVIETMAQGLMFCDENLKIVRTNTKALAMSEKPASDWAPGKDIRELVRAYIADGVYEFETVDEFTRLSVAAFKSGKEWRALRRQRDGRIIEETVKKRGGGGFVATYSDVTDVTTREKRLEELTEELTRARDAAEAGARAKSQFLANMSHEIRTPMNGVIGMASLLLESGLSTKQKEMAQVIVNSGDNLLMIINDILDFSRLEAGKMSIVEEAFDLRAVVEDVAALLGVKVQEKGLELMIRYAPRLGQAFLGDAGRLRQAITNLVGNAVKFTEQGHVFISVDGARRGEIAEIEIAVEDTGCGVPADKLETIFQAFEQADGSAARRHDGSGLGLAITRRLVEAMGGAVAAESRLRVGSTFRIRMPLRIDPAAAEPSPQTVTVGLRALVVDDNRVNRNILVEQLASWGIAAVPHAQASTAFADIEAASVSGAPYDIAILDHQMPETDGVALARLLRSSPKASKTPLILLTSAGRKGDPGDVVRALFNAYLVKPARASMLHDAIVSVLNERATSFVQAAREIVAVVEDEAGAAISRPLARVLVAEDNVVNQMVIAAMLEKLGCEARIASNGVEAVEGFKTFRPDIILMDISMPDMDGAEACRRIREIESVEGGRTPIIGVTAHAMKEDRERCLEAGMDDHLPKPVKSDLLRDALARWTPAFAKSA